MTEFGTIRYEVGDDKVATITIDGTSFSGLAGNYTLIDGATLTGFNNITFNYTSTDTSDFVPTVSVA